MLPSKLICDGFELYTDDSFARRERVGQLLVQAIHPSSLLGTELPGRAAYVGDHLLITDVQPLLQAIAFLMCDYGFVPD
jgi:hypothetical protein